MTGIRDQIINGTEQLINRTMDELRDMVLRDSPAPSDREANDVFTRLLRLSRFLREFSNGSSDVDPRTMLDVVDFLTKS